MLCAILFAAHMHPLAPFTCVTNALFRMARVFYFQFYFQLCCLSPTDLLAPTVPTHQQRTAQFLKGASDHCVAHRVTTEHRVTMDCTKYCRSHQQCRSSTHDMSYSSTHGKRRSKSGDNASSETRLVFGSKSTNYSTTNDTRLSLRHQSLYHSQYSTNRQLLHHNGNLKEFGSTNWSYRVIDTL